MVVNRFLWLYFKYLKGFPEGPKLQNGYVKGSMVKWRNSDNDPGVQRDLFR